AWARASAGASVSSRSCSSAAASSSYCAPSAGATPRPSRRTRAPGRAPTAPATGVRDGRAGRPRWRRRPRPPTLSAGSPTFARWVQRVFVDVQEGVGRRDMSTLNDRLTPQEYARLQAQCDRLRSARQTNRVEQIQFKRADVTEAWQESGQDWATVYVAASLVDYTLDDTTRNLVDGSRTPQDVEEYWTFTRPVGPTPWRLSAIQTS